MAKVKQKAFHPGVKRVGGKPREFTRDELKAYADGTNAAIVAGVPIPLLKKHATLGADDLATSQFSATDGAGWLEGVNFDPADGSLEWEMNVPAEIKKGIDDGTIKFTSPEFRPHYKPNNPAIAFEGPMIRHVAFTPAPRDPVGQGAIEAVAMSEDAIQCSDDDFPPKDKAPADAKPDDNPPADEAAKPNPDMPANVNDKSKTAALLACISQLGAELPSDFDLKAEGALDLLLAVFKTLAKSKSEADAEETVDKPEVNETSAPVSFSEEEIAKYPANVQAIIRKQIETDAKIAQFAEEKKASQREKAIADVTALRLPPGIKAQLLATLGTVQFSEGGELPSLGVTEVAKLIAGSLPPNVQFDEAAVAEPPHAEGEKFFRGEGECDLSAEEIKRMNDEIMSRSAALPPRRDPNAKRQIIYPGHGQLPAIPLPKPPAPSQARQPAASGKK